GSIVEVENYEELHQPAHVWLFANENGIFVYGYIKKGEDVAKAFVKTLDTDLNILLSDDITELFPKGMKNLVKKVSHQETGHLMLQLNMNEISKGNGFSGLKLKSKIEESSMGVLIYDGDGVRNFVAPSFENGFMFSRSDFYVDE